MPIFTVSNDLHHDIISRRFADLFTNTNTYLFVFLHATLSCSSVYFRATACMCFNRPTYTVSHKTRATLFLIITLVFLDRFLYFLHQWKDEGILYIGVYHFSLTVSPHYLAKLKRHINSTFWSQSSQCVRSNRLLATCAEICPMFLFSNSW